MKAVLWILLSGLQWSSHVVSAEVKFELVQEVKSLENSIASSDYKQRWRRTGNDVTQCAAACKLMADCVSFFVERSTSFCQFHTSVLSDPSGMAASDNTSYYVLGESTVTATSSPACPSGTGWYTNQGSCYYIDNVNVTTFDDSKAFCESLGGYLLKVNDADEHAYFEGILPSVSIHMSIIGFWIGLVEVTTGVWAWDNDGEVATFTDWDNGQPEINLERCSMYYKYSYKWHDLSCTGSYLYTICEK